MYTEDMELCYRVREAGYKVVYFPEMVIQHIGQGSSNREFAIVNIYKGLLYFYKKHKSYPEYLFVKSLLLFKAWFAILVGSLTQNAYLTTTYKKAIQF